MEQHDMQPDEFDTALAALNFATENDTPYIPAPRQAVQKFELKNISHTHESIMNWLLANPEKNQGECARVFGVTQSWLSVLIHSNLFQARLKEKQEVIFSNVAVGLNEKLGALADVGVEKLAQLVETSNDPKLLLETTKMALGSLGFGGKTPVAGGTVNAQNVQQNFYVASQADLEAARGRMATQGAVSPPVECLPAPADATLTSEQDEVSGPLVGMRSLAHAVMGPDAK